MIHFVCAFFFAFTGQARVVDSRLSSAEKSQLGHFKMLRSGRVSRFRHPTHAEWPRVREWLVDRSRRANPSLDLALTAYTPGETLALMKAPAVLAWQNSVSRFVIPERYRRIVFVPCAKTKPWTFEKSKASRLYQSYHRVLREAGDDVYFVTLSEPLGVVPQDRWADFPQYDNPGLFRDDALRSGALLSEWLESPFRERLVLPFDDRAYETAVSRLGEVIAEFIAVNRQPGRTFFSFVDSVRGHNTHAEMLDRALAKVKDVPVHRAFRRPAPRTAPCQFILKTIGS